MKRNSFNLHNKKCNRVGIIFHADAISKERNLNNKIINHFPETIDEEMGILLM